MIFSKALSRLKLRSYRRRCLRIYGLPWVPALFDPDFDLVGWLNDPNSRIQGNEVAISQWICRRFMDRGTASHSKVVERAF